MRRPRPGSERNDLKLDLDDWPPPADDTPYYLTAAGELRETPPDPGELTLLVDPEDPVPTLGGPNHFGDLEVDLWSTAIVFNAGHRIRVDVAGSNWLRLDVNPNDGGDHQTGVPTVARPDLLFGTGHLSALVLPIVKAPRRVAGRLQP